MPSAGLGVTDLRSNHTPTIDTAYWPSILLASICGTNLGDLNAHQFPLGPAAGFALLIALAVVAFAAERVDRRAHELWFWLVILIIRTGATNISDMVSHALKPLHMGQVPRAVFALLVAGLLALCARFSRFADGEGAKLESGAWFWLAMLAAGVFGTAAGDVVSHVLGQGVASLALGALLVASLALWQRAPALAAYWLAVALARSAGTAIGDWLAESPITDLGLPLSSGLTTAVFVLVVLWGQRRRRDAGLVGGALTA